MTSRAWIAPAVLAVIVLGGCEVHDDDDVVIEGETLVARDGGCVVQGTIRNEADERIRVSLVWTALDDDDDAIGTADVEIRNLEEDETRAFESSRFREFDGDRSSCAEIDRTRRNEVVFDD
ncbi:MAG: FxLYD domain-containing protein [Candidatus Rokuibacteriota bacterium]